LAGVIVLTDRTHAQHTPVGGRGLQRACLARLQQRRSGAARVPLVSRLAVMARGGLLAPTWRPHGPGRRCAASLPGGAAPNSLPAADKPLARLPLRNYDRPGTRGGSRGPRFAAFRADFARRQSGATRARGGGEAGGSPAWGPRGPARRCAASLPGGAAPNSLPGGADAPLARPPLRNYDHPRTRDGFWGPRFAAFRTDFAGRQSGAPPTTGRQSQHVRWRRGLGGPTGQRAGWPRQHLRVGSGDLDELFAVFGGDGVAGSAAVVKVEGDGLAGVGQSLLADVTLGVAAGQHWHADNVAAVGLALEYNGIAHGLMLSPQGRCRLRLSAAVLVRAALPATRASLRGLEDIAVIFPIPGLALPGSFGDPARMGAPPRVGIGWN